jgi:hypothetical protein
MERSKYKDDGKVLYKKVKGGSLYFFGKRIKAGEVFRAYPKDIPDAFKDQIVALEDSAVEKEETEVQKPDSGYQLQHRGASWWNVIDKYGKQINDKALKKDDAQTLIEELEA